MNIIEKEIERAYKEIEDGGFLKPVLRASLTRAVEEEYERGYKDGKNQIREINLNCNQ